MAEVYGVADWRALPLRVAAALAAGLPADSRIFRQLHGIRDYPSVLMMGEIIDLLRILVWQNTENGKKGRNFPQRMVDFLLTPVQESKASHRGFATTQEFDEAYRRFIGESER